MHNAETLFDAGLDCLAAGDWQGAIAQLREALALDPSHRDAAHGLMRALDQSGQGEEAAAVAHRLIANDPNDVLARTGLSMIYQRMGKIPEAEKAALDAKLLSWKLELAQKSSPKAPTAGDPRPKLYVASSNPGKLRDFSLASGGRVLLLPLPGLADIPPPEEDAATFEGNAELKARFYAGFAPGEIVLADDSGLEVDGLNGRPGVRSARFAEDVRLPAKPGESLDQQNNRCLLESIRGITGPGRRARYRCALVAVRDGVVLAQASGSVEGALLDKPQGEAGFGYDPLFVVEELGRTMAELEPGERLHHSHRGRALRALLDRMIAQRLVAE